MVFDPFSDIRHLAQRDESNRRRDEFVAMMAHELRNPLSPIRTGLQLRDPRDRERGFQAGFDHYLVKPADVEVIVDLMRACDGKDTP